MNTKTMFATVGDWVEGLVQLSMGLVALAVLTEILFGTAYFGTSVLTNIVSLVGSVGSAGFAGVVSLLILVGMFYHRN